MLTEVRIPVHLDKVATDCQLTRPRPAMVEYLGEAVTADVVGVTGVDVRRIEARVSYKQLGFLVAVNGRFEQGQVRIGKILTEVVKPPSASQIGTNCRCAAVSNQTPGVTFGYKIDQDLVVISPQQRKSLTERLLGCADLLENWSRIRTSVYIVTDKDNMLSAATEPA